MSKKFAGARIALCLTLSFSLFFPLSLQPAPAWAAVDHYYFGGGGGGGAGTGGEGGGGGTAAETHDGSVPGGSAASGNGIGSGWGGWGGGPSDPLVSGKTDGGDGANLTATLESGQGGNLSVRGGDGGAAGAAGHGGQGGSVSLTGNGTYSFGYINITGGLSGPDDISFRGGLGGAAGLSINGSLFTNQLNVAASGGGASLAVTERLELSGVYTQNVSAASGSAALSAGTVAAVGLGTTTLMITGSSAGGAVTADFENIEALKGNFGLNLIDTDSATNPGNRVAARNLHIGSGWTLGIYGSSADSFEWREGGSLTAAAGAYLSAKLNADTHSLNFDLSGVMPGAHILNIVYGGGLTLGADTQVNLIVDAENAPRLFMGDNIYLTNNNTDTAAWNAPNAPGQLLVRDSAGNLAELGYNLDKTADALHMQANNDLQTDGNWVIDQDRGWQSASGAPAKFVVGGALTLAENSSPTLTVAPGKSVADSLFNVGSLVNRHKSAILDFTGNGAMAAYDGSLSTSDGAYIDTIVLSGSTGNQLTISGQQGVNYNWGGKLAVENASKLVSATDMDASGGVLEFQLQNGTSGSFAQLDMSGGAGQLVLNENTNITISGLSSLLGTQSLLADGVTGTINSRYANLQSFTVHDGRGNSGSLISSLQLAANKLSLTADNFTAEGDWQLRNNVDVSGAASFDVGGMLYLNGKSVTSISSGPFKAGGLYVTGNTSVLDFANLISTTDNRVIEGDIVLADAVLDLHGSVQGTNFAWTGGPENGLVVLGYGIIRNGALDVSGKTLSFSLAGLTSGQTALQGGLVGDSIQFDAATKFAVSGQPADFGSVLTLTDIADSGVSHFDNTYTATINDQDGNSATLGYDLEYTQSNTTLELQANSLAAKGDWTLPSNLNLYGNSKYTVDHTLNLEGNNITAINGFAGEFRVGALAGRAGSSTLDFSNSSGGTKTIGDIIIGNRFDKQGQDLGGSNRIDIKGGAGTWGWKTDSPIDITVYGSNNELYPQIKPDLTNSTLTFHLAANQQAGQRLLNYRTSDGNYYNPDLILTDSTTVQLVARHALNELHKGDTLTLLSGVDGMASGASWQEGQSITTLGGATYYAFDVKLEIQSLLATYQGVTGIDQGIAHNALLAAPALLNSLNQGGWIAAGAAENFQPSGRLLTGTDVQIGGYVYMGGGHYEAKANSHIESDSFHILAGPGFRFSNAAGQTDLGVFVEAGWGNFDTYNSFYRGDGDTTYYGLGLLARHEFQSGLYAEGSLRGGRAESEYSSRYSTGYDMSGAYYGGHLGAGYLLPVSDSGSLDFSAKLLYTHMEGDTDTNKYGAKMKVDDSESLRSQLGLGYRHSLCDQLDFSARVSWEYEFDGETKGRYDGISIDKTDLGGSSGIGELGLAWTPSERVEIGAGVHGIVGQREGYGGDLKFKFKF